MLAFIAILFILAIAFFIGERTGKSVPDEIGPARKYLVFGIDALLLIMLGFTLYSYGQPILAVGVPVLLVLGRKHFTLAYAPVSGIIIAAAMLVETKLIILTLCLLFSFLVGAVFQKSKRDAIVQPTVALVLSGILSLLL